jgi:hypothetical protein
VEFLSSRILVRPIDPDHSRRFYAEVLGLTVYREFPVGTVFFPVEGDIKACFDEISHMSLMDIVRERVGDKRVLALVKAFLKAGILTEDGTLTDTTAGTPQGPILSCGCRERHPWALTCELPDPKDRRPPCTPRCFVVLRLPYLAVTGVFALLRLLPASNTDKDIEILVLRHQLAILRRQVNKPHQPSEASAAHQFSVCPSRNRRCTVLQPPGLSGPPQGTARAASRGVYASAWYCPMCPGTA